MTNKIRLWIYLGFQKIYLDLFLSFCTRIHYKYFLQNSNFKYRSDIDKIN